MKLLPKNFSNLRKLTIVLVGLVLLELSAHAQSLHSVTESSASSPAAAPTSSSVSGTIATTQPVTVGSPVITAKSSELSNSLSAIWETVVSFWNYQILVVDNSPITAGKLILALLMFPFGLRLARRLSAHIRNRLVTSFHVEPSAAVTVETISFYSFLLIWTVICLHLLSIPLTVFTLAGGALAIGVGFGSQTIVKNFFSGLILLVERPIRVGDLIQYENVIGTISRIGTRSTVISTGDQLEVVIPNSFLVENMVTNWTLSTDRMRRKVSVGVVYRSNSRQVQDVLLAAAKKNPAILSSPEPDVIFSDFGDNAKLFTLRFWVKLGDRVEPLHVESELRHLIDQDFAAAGIEFAFPQLDIHLGDAARAGIIAKSS